MLVLDAVYVTYVVMEITITVVGNAFNQRTFICFVIAEIVKALVFWTVVSVVKTVVNHR
jgi:hypothetical protein